MSSPWKVALGVAVQPQLTGVLGSPARVSYWIPAGIVAWTFAWLRDAVCGLLHGQTLGSNGSPDELVGSDAGS